MAYSFKHHSLSILKYCSGIIALWLCLAVSLFYAAPPLYTKAEYWIPEVLALKERHAAQISSPKILVLSGSNGLFGIDSALLEQETGMPVANLAAHSELGADFLFELMRHHAKPGDIVLLPWEYRLYYQTEATDLVWQGDQFTTWGRAYLDNAPPATRALYLRTCLPGYPLRLRNAAKPLPVRSLAELDRQLPSPLPPLSRRDAIYRPEGLTSSLDMLCDLSATAHLQDMTREGIPYLEAKPVHAPAIIKFLHFAKENGIRLYFSFPTTIKNHQFDLSRPEHRRELDTLTHDVTALGGAYIGDPRLSNLDVAYFLDTKYHLNAEGAVLRTLFLADAVNSEVLHTAEAPDISDIEAYQRLKAEQARIILTKMRQ